MNREIAEPGTSAPRIGIVANEPSGDQLGAGLIRAIRARCPDARFEGVAGPEMLAEGCSSLVPMEQLSVMGLVEVVSHLPKLLAIRRHLAQHFLRNRPRVFIGVDAPDFNLGLEAWLHRAGIKTVHYVSPTVWAWRSGRVKTLRRSVDLMLSVFQFETEFLEQHGVPVRYVGHPLAGEIGLTPDRKSARSRLGLDQEGILMALLPGSRVSEVRSLSTVFIESARWCLRRRPDLHFVAPLVNTTVRGLFEEALRKTAADLRVTLVDGNSRDVLSAADLVLTASGTATLEAMLHKRPMVVAYRLNPLTYRIAKTLKLLKVPYVAMANLLAGEELAPEFIQDACRPEAIGAALMEFVDRPRRVAEIQSRYLAIHREMRVDVGDRAAAEVLELIGIGQTGG